MAEVAQIKILVLLVFLPEQYFHTSLMNVIIISIREVAETAPGKSTYDRIGVDAWSLLRSTHGVS